MTCDGCAGIVHSGLARRPNVAGVTVDYAKKRVVVRYDPAKPIQPERAVGVARASGYAAVLLEANP